MDPSSLILISVAAVAIMAMAGAFTVAFQRSKRPGGVEEPGPRHDDSRPPQVTPVAVKVSAESEPAAALEEKAESSGVTLVETQRIVEISPEEGGVTRRQFFNRALSGLFGSFLAIMGGSSLAFFWPRLTGGFGTKVDAGPVDDIRAQLTQPDGSIAPVAVSEARAYVVPISSEQLGGSQFEQPGLVADGLMAMWWRCVHLGCRAPWCSPSAGFECPCHGSKYNLFGEYQAGPAPRNLDRFAVEVTADGRLIIDTGTIVQTPRAPRDSVPYPQGPSCIAI
ncbi:MAG: ubiquinol-cytochrome c reductase iron-sulfur subunit [Acidimicrobiia bacterium]